MVLVATTVVNNDTFKLRKENQFIIIACVVFLMPKTGVYMYVLAYMCVVCVCVCVHSVGVAVMLFPFF